MPFTEERAERLTALLGLIEKNGDRGELTYRAVPHLREIDEIVEAQLASKELCDKETLLDGAAILRYLAEAYERLGRPSVSAGYYGKAVAIAAMLCTEHDAQIEDGKGLVYKALKARNYYADDDCEDLRERALAFLPKECVDEVFRTVMGRRRNLKHDPVEMTEEYLAVIDEVEAKIEKNRRYFGFGSCHHVWSLKTDYLAEKGIVWRSPVILNPRVMFD